jgi:hypothetical protein
MAHRIRKMMELGTIEKEKLQGEIEVDETYVGGKSKNMHASRRQEMQEKGFPKPCVFGLKECESGNVRMMIVPDATKDSLQTTICQNVKPGADVYTDSAKGYIGLSTAYNHETVDHNKGQYVRVEGERVITTNGIENYWSLLDRCSYGTQIHQSEQHLPRYLAEEDFRYNSRKMKDGKRFEKAMGRLNDTRLTYNELPTGHLQHIAPK